MDNNTDLAWERLGRDDPYFGVMTQPQSRAASQAGAERDEFFGSGRSHIERVVGHVRELVPDFAPHRALDFGCGVGRLVVPLSRVADEVVGIDVSPSMLAEARRNCNEAGLTNVTLCRSDDALSELKGSFDFIHSFIVFQHIPVARGMTIVEGLIDRLDPGGVGALHFVYSRTQSFSRRVMGGLSRWIPGVHTASNILRGRPARQPPMQMNPYPLERIYALLQASGCHRLSTRFSDHQGSLGALLIFQRHELAMF